MVWRLGLDFFPLRLYFWRIWRLSCRRSFCSWCSNRVRQVCRSINCNARSTRVLHAEGSFSKSQFIEWHHNTFITTTWRTIDVWISRLRAVKGCLVNKYNRVWLNVSLGVSVMDKGEETDVWWRRDCVVAFVCDIERESESEKKKKNQEIKRTGKMSSICE